MSKEPAIVETTCIRHQLMELTMSNLEVGLKSLNGKVDRLDEKFDKVISAMNGTLEKKGVVTVVWEHDEWIKDQKACLKEAEKEEKLELKAEIKEDKKIKRDWFDYLIKAIFGILLAYLTYRVTK